MRRASVCGDGSVGLSGCFMAFSGRRGARPEGVARGREGRPHDSIFLRYGPTAGPVRFRRRSRHDRQRWLANDHGELPGENPAAGGRVGVRVLAGDGHGSHDAHPQGSRQPGRQRAKRQYSRLGNAESRQQRSMAKRAGLPTTLPSSHRRGSVPWTKRVTDRRPWNHTRADSGWSSNEQLPLWLYAETDGGLWCGPEWSGCWQMAVRPTSGGRRLIVGLPDVRLHDESGPADRAADGGIRALCRFGRRRLQSAPPHDLPALLAD